MTEKKIHIVSFDVPFPADYGGAIDVFYRIKSLHHLGYKITLHCFEYGRGEHKQLEEITEQVHYYSRKKTLLNFFNKRPFIVASRRSKKLLKRLLEDENPILFEGLHTTWFLEHPSIQKRLTFVRTHNIEHDYYAGLAEKSNAFKRYYFQQESKKLTRYETILSKTNHVLCIRKGDVEHFKKYNPHTHILPASTPPIKQTVFHKTDEYALFHGNLSVAENSDAVKWIIHTIWKEENKLIPLKIAGKNPSQELINLTKSKGIELIENPSDEELHTLLIKANVHVLYSDQSTGVKLKLLAALQTSGHILVNPIIVEGTNLGEMCTICHSSEEFMSQLQFLADKKLDLDAFNKRQAFLMTHYSTEKNCLIFDDLIR